METAEELSGFLEFSRKEVDAWRESFLQENFQGSFKIVSEKDKNILKAFFMSIPSANFTTPWNEWSKCVSTLLRQKDQEKID